MIAISFFLFFFGAWLDQRVRIKKWNEIIWDIQPRSHAASNENGTALLPCPNETSQLSSKLPTLGDTSWIIVGSFVAFLHASPPGDTLGKYWVWTRTWKLLFAPSQWRTKHARIFQISFIDSWSSFLFHLNKISIILLLIQLKLYFRICRLI